MKFRLFACLVFLPMFVFGQFAPFPTAGLAFGEIYNRNIFDGGGYYNSSFHFIGEVSKCGKIWDAFTPGGSLFLRAENGKYYVYNSADCQKPFLFYDFSKSVGDTILTYDYLPGSLQKFVVQEKGLFTLQNGENRIKMVVYRIDFPADKRVWVDGLGDLRYGFLRQRDFEGGNGELICVRDSTGILFHSLLKNLDCDSLLCPVPSPIFDFDCTDQTFHFTNQSTKANSFLWDFGDGQTSTETNPTHTFQNAGCYRVTLRAMSDCLPTKSYENYKLVNVNAPHFWKKAANQPPLYSKVQMLDAQNGWALAGKTILKTTDGGVHWDSTAYPGVPRGLQKLHFKDPTHGIISIQLNPNYAYDFDILWTNDGQTWQLDTFSESLDISAIERINDTMAVFARSAYTTIYTTKNGGASWTKTSTLGGVSLIKDFQSVGGESVYFIGVNQDNPIFQSFVFGKTTDGLNWSAFPQPDILGATKMSFINPQEGWMTNGLSVFHTQNAGETWTKQADLPETNVEIAFSDAQNGWACGYHTGIYHTTDGGQTWSQEACVRSLESLSNLQVLSKNEAFVGSKDGYLKYDALPDSISTCKTSAENEVKNEPRSFVFPNPAAEQIKVSLPAAAARLTVFDALGRVVFEKKLEKNELISNFQIEVKNWSSGLYFLKMQRADGQQTMVRFVKI